MSGGLDQRALARSSRGAALVSLLGLAVLVATVGYSYVHLADLDRRIEEREERLADLQRQLKEADEELQEKRATLAKITPIALQGLGYKDPHSRVPVQVVEQSAMARQQAQRIAEPSGVTRRRAVTIQYFPRRLDDEVNMKVVLSALSEAGFNLERKQAQLPGVPTNAIWFGPDVHVDDAKFVAYTLMSAGVQLRAVRPFRDPAGRRRVIQIGADLALAEAPPLTVEHIRSATTFTR